MELKSLLRRCASKDTQSEVKHEETESELFSKYYHEWKGKEHSNVSYKAIPKFYHKIPKEEDTLLRKLLEESRTLFLSRRNRQLIENDDLKALWRLLNTHHSPPIIAGEEKMINYDDFLKVISLACPNVKLYLSPIVFGKLLKRDPYGRVSIADLFQYVMRKVWLNQSRIGLSLYDLTGQGYLREHDLGSYILDMGLSPVMALEKSFHSFYQCTAVRKFFFFLDPLCKGRVRIQDILASGFLDEISELRGDVMPKNLLANWFSAPSALRVYGQYLNLDRDHNGMLNRKELADYGTGMLTQVFLERVFQECNTYGGEMDYKTYLDFVLALENRQEPQALHYLFRILDINGKGYLDTFCLNYFFRGIQEQMALHGQEEVSFENIKDEIFDMVKPADPTKITLQDLLNCGQGDTIVSLLIDLNGFWSHENREALSPDSGSDAAEV
ncbi:serine/threonine-protein phosphatase 2A regulatory subunit B'' subunit gamma-like [Ischnura elegans]|uniref:serine/threonine-protein phosphatase 2A regulatory subunit B'' subunit gamma-like n=1 Tax=Ischnura elegans TaxID=197161 RepID=UPI001ED8966C|nr:serine/threonine-protein phosphatase 2A regulatory subunit B'' subunit gamma-like [Ischnura elegans]